MGKVGFKLLQESLFNRFAQEKNLRQKFYFTDGTALSVFYLQHRQSDDLDFFSSQDFENTLVLDFMKKISEKLAFPFRFTQQEKTRIFELVKNDKFLLKVDFAYYPYERLKSGLKFKEVEIDSLLDIAANKLLSINQRTDVKDFVDLYFLFEHFTLWDLLDATKKKFRVKLDLLLIASDFLKIEKFDFLPKMLIPLKLKTIQGFFKKKALQIGKKISRK